MVKKKRKKFKSQAKREALIRFEIEQLRRKSIKKKQKKKLTVIQRENLRILSTLRKIEQARAREPIRALPPKPRGMRQLESFKAFGRVPIVKRPLIDEASIKDVRSADEVDFLGGETMMFSDDMIGTEIFVPKRIEDL